MIMIKFFYELNLYCIVESFSHWKKKYSYIVTYSMKTLFSTLVLILKMEYLEFLWSKSLEVCVYFFVLLKD